MKNIKLITSVWDPMYNRIILVAVCDDNTVWQKKGENEWRRIDDIPNKGIVE
jgi:hypothetical protein